MLLAIAGVGNNISALVQGIAFYGAEPGGGMPGVARPSIGGISVADVEVVAAFDPAPGKAGEKLADAIFAPPNNYPVLGVGAALPSTIVLPGILDPADSKQVEAVSAALTESGAEVLLYSLPTGKPEIAAAYGRAAVAAGVAVVNCTPDPIAGLPDLMAEARAKNVALVGDDLQSHMGSSIVHGTLLALFEERGITLEGSYQLNIGGNADFENLRRNGAGKESSKHRALKQKIKATDAVTVIPSAGFVGHLGDRKIGHMSLEGRGWADMPVRIDMTLQVQDSSNAAGVIIDLIRIAALAHRRGEGGFPVAATSLLKSPHIEGDAHQQLSHSHEVLSALSQEGA